MSNLLIDNARAILTLHGESIRVTDKGREQWVSFKVESGEVPVTPDTVGTWYLLTLIGPDDDAA